MRIDVGTGSAPVQRWAKTVETQHGRERAFGNCFGLTEIQNARERCGEVKKEEARNTAHGQVAPMRTRGAAR